ncbi:MAG: alpha/beta hydrolase [Sphingomonadales bacterium]|nr:MAG: alpha/beta hydrolase [Sphingomonadales bacterium]
MPGSAAELSAYGPDEAQAARDFHVVVRAPALLDGPPAFYFERMAAQILGQFPEGPLELIGFSAGAAAALRLAPHLGARVQRIDLVSPAAPLALGDFLGSMAGEPVFRAALAGRAPFAALTWAQAQVVRLAPTRMAAALMAKARGADRELAADPHFLRHLALSLRASLIEQRGAYICEIRHYVSDWRPALAEIEAPVAIWQGSEDDWTPSSMAQALAEALPVRPDVTMLAGLSHFSALRCYLASRADRGGQGA